MVVWLHLKYGQNMADPITLTALGVSAAATVGGGILGAQGAKEKAQAESSMYNYQAGVAKVNAQIAEQDANYAEASGQVEAEQSGMKTAVEVGKTRAAFGASNVAGGSHDQVLSSEREIGAENQGIIQANAAKRAYGFEVGAAEDVAQAGADTAAGKNALTAGQYAATSSILGTVGSVASKWLGAKNAFGSPTTSPTGDPTYDNYGFNVS